MAKISVYDSLHFGTRNIPPFSVFFRESGVPIGYIFFCISIKEYIKSASNFGKISARITVFRRKTAAVNINYQQKFYDNGALSVLRKLKAVSAELPAILKKNGKSR